MAVGIGIALTVLGFAVGFIIASIVGAGITINLVVVLLLFVAGLIVGYIVEWVIDESVRRNQDLQRQLAEQRNGPVLVEGQVVNDPAGSSEVLTEVLRQLHELRETRIAVPASVAEPTDGAIRNSDMLAEILREHKDELHQLGEQLSAKDEQAEVLRQEFESYQQSHPDELTQIRGIGPVYQRKLRDIGFNSFKQLASADPDRIRRMLDVKSWQRVDIASWIQQAADWAQDG